MTVFRSIIGAAGALCLVAGTAAAEPYQSFLDMCLDGNGDAQAAAAAARAVGWNTMPKGVAETMAAEFRDPVVHLNFDPDSGNVPDSPEILLTGWGSGDEVLEVAGVRLDVCMVVSPELSRSTAERRLTDLLGFGPSEVGGERAWVFSRDGGRFRSEEAVLDLDDAELPGYLRRRKLYIIGLLSEDDMSGVMFGALRPE